MLSLLCLGTGAVQAQDLLQTRRHSVSLSLGFTGGGYRYETFNSYEYQSPETLKGLYKEKHESFGQPALVVDYAYRIWKNIHIGAEYSYGSAEGWITPGYAATDRKTRYSHQYINSLMPYAKWYFHYDPACHLYVKAGVGPQITSGEIESTRLVTAWEIIPIGITLGRRIHFVGELGYGSCYFLRLGVGYNF